MKDDKIRVAITQGDINGIGYEVILKALEDNRILELCTPVVYGSAKIAAHYRKLLEMPAIQFNQCRTSDEIKDGAYNIINVVGEDTRLDPGQSTDVAGQAAFAALEAAVADLRAGRVDVLVTAPINKNNIQSETFTFPGHTEYLEASLGEEGDKALMILCNERMRVALTTTHLPVAQVPAAITRQSVLSKIESLARSLRHDLSLIHI